MVRVKKAESKQDRQLRVNRYKHRETAKREALKEEATKAVEKNKTMTITKKAKKVRGSGKSADKKSKIQAYLHSKTVQKLMKNKVVIVAAHVVYALIIASVVSGIGYGIYRLTTIKG